MRDLCHVDTCTRPGCSRQAGCQGHAERELAPEPVNAAAERACELLKALRVKPLTIDEVITTLRCSQGSAKGWIDEFVAQGLVVVRIRQKGAHTHGYAPREFLLAEAWGGATK